MCARPSRTRTLSRTWSCDGDQPGILARTGWGRDHEAGPALWRPGRQRKRHRGGSERHMVKEHARLKLGKRASFVKTHIKQLPRVKETWEADFREVRTPAEQTERHYLGLVVALP